jgi:hypothetical protein
VKMHYLFLMDGLKGTVCGVHNSCRIYEATDNYDEVTCGNCKRKVEVYKYTATLGARRPRKRRINVQR